MRRKSLIAATAVLMACLWASPVFGQRSRESAFVENLLTEAVSILETEPAKAAAILRGLDAKYEPNDAVKYYLGIVEYSHGELAKAEQYFLQAAAMDSTNLWYKDALADIYAAQGRRNESADLYLELLSQNPARYANAYTYSLLGDRYLSEYKDSLAMESYEKALAHTPGYPPAVLGQADIYRMRRNEPAYLATLKSFIEDPTVVPYAKTTYMRKMMEGMGPVFYRNWSAQLDTLVNACVRVHPSDSSALKLAGWWYYGTDRKKLGRSYYDSALELYPEDLDLQYTKLSLLYEERDMDAVIRQCEKIVQTGGERNPKVIDALAMIGDAYYRKNEQKKAFKAYERVLQVDPEYALTLNNYAYFLSINGRKLAKAEKMSRKAVEKAPDNPQYLDTYGWILHLLGRDKEAKPYFKHAMIYGGKESCTVLLHYSKVLEALGEKQLSDYYRSLADARPAEE